MSLTLLIAPAGAGKTTLALEKICAHSAAQPLAQSMLLLPSHAHIRDARARLAAHKMARLGITLTEFAPLYRVILDAAGIVVRLISEAARYRFLRALLRERAANNTLEYFAPIAAKVGLVQALAQFISDAKRARLAPETLMDIADTPRLRDLARLYAAYQKFLQDHALADDEGVGWLALQALENDALRHNDFAYIAIDGFDEFDPTQAALLHLLAARNPQVDLTLTYQAGRAAHARFERVLAQFPNAAREYIFARVPPRRGVLEHIERALFEINAPRVACDDTLQVVAAADRLREVQHIARAVKQTILNGAPPASIAVLFRSLTLYQPLVRQVFQQYSIPFRLRGGMTLISNPLIAEILNLLTLPANNFPRRETMDALRSSYFVWRDLDAAAVAHIDTLTRQAVVVRGRDAFLDAFVKPKPDAARMERDQRLVTELDAEKIADYRAALENFFARLTPPASATVAQHAEWLEDLLGDESDSDDAQADDTSLRVVERVRAGDDETAARDLAALSAFKRVLSGLVQAAHVLGEREDAWNDFLADLRDALAGAVYDLTPAYDGRVLIASVPMARGIPYQTIFLGGLVESEFPARASEDVLLTEHEQRVLEQAGLARASFHAGDEKTYFYQAVTLAREKLYLSYPRTSEDARPLIPSPYLQDLRALFDELPERKMQLNAAPEIAQAASLNELAVALARTPLSVVVVSDELRARLPAWAHSEHARAIEARRESNAPHDAYSGIFDAADLRAEMRALFDTRYPWSASQLNEWGACGFRFFAARLLHLEETLEPAEGLGVLQRGALYHAILEETYKKFAAQNLAVTPATLEQTQIILDETAVQVLDNSPARFAFRPTPWWAQERAEITRTLHQLLDAEAGRNGENAPLPYEFEKQFDVTLNIGNAFLRVRGIVDRIDQSGDGLVLVDYKSGSTKIPKREVYEGRNLQLPVYVMALRAQGEKVADAFFVHLPNGETSGQVDQGERAAWLARAREHIHNYLDAARAGTFAVKPTRFENGACNNYCDFAALCRAGRWSSNK